MVNNYKEIPLGKAVDLSQQKFGRLTPLYRTENVSNKTAWVCQCDCGNIVVTTADQLKRGHTKSCGCFQKEQASKSNSSKIAPGQKFGRLTVLRKVQKEKTSINDRYLYWECECDCGNKVVVASNNLNSGHTQSCGCLKRERTSEIKGIDLTGQQIGLLTVLHLDKEKNNKKRYWICKCECGNIKSIAAEHLLSQDTKSCGQCSHMSYGALKIQQLLQENNLTFTKEQTFPTCKNPNTNRLFRFDFYVENKYLIEYDGQQHFYNPVGLKWTDDVEIVQKRDQMKNQWCKENNMPLIRIPYTQFNDLTIEDLKLETTKFLI